MIAGPDATSEDIQKITQQLGLDRSLVVQLFGWYGRLVQGDLGRSIFLRKPVVDAILDRVEPTLLLTLASTLIAVLIGVPSGVISARFHNSATDQAFMTLALVGISIPNFLLGLIFVLVFGVWLAGSRWRGTRRSSTAGRRRFDRSCFPRSPWAWCSRR